MSARIDFIEKHFTTSRFADCEKQIAELLMASKVDSGVTIALSVIEIAAVLALNKQETAKSKLVKLISNVSKMPANFKLNWTLNGTVHFISQNETLSPYRQWLLQFLHAMEGENRDAILNALKDVRKGFQAFVRKE